MSLLMLGSQGQGMASSPYTVIPAFLILSIFIHITL